MIVRLGIAGIGFTAPGLDDAAALWAHLDGAPVAAPEGWRPRPRHLPARDMRRLSPANLLAIAAAEQIAPNLPKDAGWVFASALGEGDTLNAILASLCQPEIMVQPLKFQNAVHNAGQGQWSILAGATGPASSIAAHDQTAGAGLLKAAMQVSDESRPVGLVIFDAPFPHPLHEMRPVALPMAAALALMPDDGIQLVEVEVVHGASASEPAESGAAPVLTGSGNPVRFILPLLARLHRLDPRPVVLALPGSAAVRIAAQGAAHAA